MIDFEDIQRNDIREATEIVLRDADIMLEAILSIPDLKSIDCLNISSFVLVFLENMDSLFPTVSAIYSVVPSLLTLIPLA